MILNSIEQCSADRTISFVAADGSNLIHQLIETGFQGCRLRGISSRLTGCKLVTNDTSSPCRIAETCAKIVHCFMVTIFFCLCFCNTRSKITAMLCHVVDFYLRSCLRIELNNGGSDSISKLTKSGNTHFCEKVKRTHLYFPYSNIGFSASYNSFA